MFLEPVADPQQSVNYDAVGAGELAKRTVAGQQGPLPLLGEGKGETVLYRERHAVAVDLRRPHHLMRFEFLDDEAQAFQLRSKSAGKLGLEQQVGHAEIERQLKQGFQKIASLQIDDDRRIRNENGQTLPQLLIQTPVELS